MEMKTARSALSPHQKLSAIRRVSVGKETKAHVARDLGVPESTLRGWFKNEKKLRLLAALPEQQLSVNKQLRQEDKFVPRPASNSSSGSRGSDHNRDIPLRPLTVSVVDDEDKERQENRIKLAKLGAELGIENPASFYAAWYYYQQLTLRNTVQNIDQSRVQQSIQPSDFLADHTRIVAASQTLLQHQNNEESKDIKVINKEDNQHENKNAKMIKREEQDSQEALQHGEKFLNWLQTCSHPSVTTHQVNVVESIIKKFKKSY